MNMLVEVDGNDGVGKSFLIKRLLALHPSLVNDFEFNDRGDLSLATDSDEFIKKEGVIYIIVDCSEELSQKRILKRGDSIEEKYHTMEDLKYYRAKFMALSAKYNIPMFSTEEDLSVDTINNIYNYIKGFKDGYNSRY